MSGGLGGSWEWIPGFILAEGKKEHGPIKYPSGKGPPRVIESPKGHPKKQTTAESSPQTLLDLLSPGLPVPQYKTRGVLTSRGLVADD